MTLMNTERAPRAGRRQAQRYVIRCVRHLDLVKPVYLQLFKPGMWVNWNTQQRYALRFDREGAHRTRRQLQANRIFGARVVRLIARKK